ncbi:MAG: helix-turn-helix domain-containing protein [Variovorax sp.]
MQTVFAERTSTLISASTVGVSPHQKFGFWQDVVCRTVVDLECRPAATKSFEATVSGTCLDTLSVAFIEATAHRVARLPGGISRANEDPLVFNFLLSGTALVEQDGRELVLKPGDGTVCESQRPYKLRFDDAFKIITIKLPREAVSHRAASIHRITARSLAEAGQLCPIVFAYLMSFAEQAPRLEASALEKVSRNFTDLLGCALDEVILGSPLPLSEYRGAALMRVKNFLERHLGECELDAVLVSSALQLSPRYINKLFEAEGTSLVRYIWRRRLERAANDLCDPARQSTAISSIAMSHGFNDLSHFSRAFRQRFDRSPRAYRLEGGSSPRN